MNADEGGQAIASVVDRSDSSTYVKLLAFGDSLTEGFFDGGRNFHPYSLQLEKCIDKHYSERAVEKEAIIHQVGKSGEKTSEMIPRLQSILARSSDSPYDFVCILAGTNDLSLRDSGDDIFGRIRQLYDLVLDHGEETILVAITIPRSYYVTQVKRRSIVNQKIKDFCNDANDRAGVTRAFMVDFENLLPYVQESDEKINVWDDHLHMTSLGYDELARIIFTAISPAL